MINVMNSLRNVDIFKNLSPVAMEQIDSIKIEKRYGKNEVLNLEDESAHHIWFLKTGRIRSVRHLSEGQELILTTIGPNVTFGVCCSFSEGNYHCDHVADMDSMVVRIPTENLKQLMRFNPEIAFNMIENLSSRLHIARRMQTMDHENVAKRLLYTLLTLKKDLGDTLQVTKKEIAEMAGTTVETCIRHMTLFEKQGMIRSSRGKIVIRNMNIALKT